MKKVVTPCGNCLVFGGITMPRKPLAEDEPITFEKCPRCDGKQNIEYEIGTEEGEECFRLQPENLGGGHCTGIISLREKDSCSASVEDRRYCPECDWEGLDDQPIKRK